jgi:hypothetical protein
MGISCVVFTYATVTGHGLDATKPGCGADSAAVAAGAPTSASVAGPGGTPRRAGGRESAILGRPGGRVAAVKAGEREPGGGWSRYQQWMAYCPDRTHLVADQVGQAISRLTQAQPSFAKLY